MAGDLSVIVDQDKLEMPQGKREAFLDNCVLLQYEKKTEVHNDTLKSSIQVLN